MDRILLIGEQRSLLAARAEVLAKTGACVTCCDTDELNDLLWDGAFDLVILCHTLLPTGVRRSAVISDVYRRWPRAKILQVVNGWGEQSTETGLDTHLMWGHPGELVLAAVRLLGEPPQERWHPLSEYTPTAKAA